MIIWWRESPHILRLYDDFAKDGRGFEVMARSPKTTGGICTQHFLAHDVIPISVFTLLLEEASQDTFLARGCI